MSLWPKQDIFFTIWGPKEGKGWKCVVSRIYEVKSYGHCAMRFLSIYLTIVRNCIKFQQ
jgi:hypothetical protein